MLKNVIQALQQFEPSGDFAAKLISDYHHVMIQVNNVGTLQFPLSSETVKQLMTQAEAVAFGRGEQTIRDPEVRDGWKINADQVTLNDAGKMQLQRIVDKVKTELGLPEHSQLTAQLHDLLIYEPGHFFKPHQDSEKCDGMVATLVVLLPSLHRGGSLLIDHKGQKREFCSSRASLEKLHYYAFYADCHHEIKPVTAGYRVALTYNLVLSQTNIQADEEIYQPALRKAVQAYFSEPESSSAKKLVYLLDHEYTPKGLSWQALKNVDQQRAAALQTVAKDLEMDIYLTLAEVHECWDAEPEYDGYGRYDSYALDADPEDVELNELIDDDVCLKYWLDDQGNSIELSDPFIHADELCWTVAHDDLQPFDSEYEGWTGNAGCTLDRWYHRAAIVLWPKSSRFPVLQKIAPEFLIKSLSEEQSVLQIRNAVQLLQSDNWKRFRPTTENLESLFKLALKLQDKTQAKQLLKHLSGTEPFSSELVPQLVKLQQAYGVDWLTVLMKDWLQQYDYARNTKKIALKPLLPFIQAWIAHLPEAHTEITDSLIKHQFEIIIPEQIQKFKTQHKASLLHGQRERQQAQEDLLESIFTAQAQNTLKSMIALLVEQKEHFWFSELVNIACYLHRKQHDSQLQALVINQIQQDLQKPMRAADDWRIQIKAECDCADCQVLHTFLQSSQQRKIWPLAKPRRQHIHGMIDQAALPVMHVTERTGSPHKLCLTKTEALFAEELKQRQQLKKALNELTGLML